MSRHIERTVIERASLYAAIVFVLMTLFVVTDAVVTAPPTTVAALAPTPTVTPVQLPPDFRSGVYPTQLGELVQVEPERITYYSRDVHGGEFFTIDD